MEVGREDLRGDERYARQHLWCALTKVCSFSLALAPGSTPCEHTHAIPTGAKRLEHTERAGRRHSRRRTSMPSKHTCANGGPTPRGSGPHASINHAACKRCTNNNSRSRCRNSGNGRGLQSARTRFALWWRPRPLLASCQCGDGVLAALLVRSRAGTKNL